MKLLSPYDLLNLFEDMRVGEQRVFYVGSFLYDRGKAWSGAQAVAIWKLSSMAQVLIDAGYATTMLKRVEDYRYKYFIRRISKEELSEEVLAKAGALENRTNIY